MKIDQKEVVANGSFLFDLYISVASYLPHSGIKIDLR